MAKRLRLVHINDIYALEGEQGTGGYARASTVIDRLRREQVDTACLVIVGGDFAGGSAVCEWSKGEAAIDILNELQVDMCCLGNHEFDFGAEHLRDVLMPKSTFEWYGSNVRCADSRELLPGVTHTRMIRVGDVSVGIFGVVTSATPRMAWPGDSVDFESPKEWATLAAQQLHEQGADVVVALTHLRVVQDLEIARVPHVDFVLGGHDHFPHAQEEHGTLVFKTGQNCHYVGVLDLNFIERVIPLASNNSRYRAVPELRLVPALGAEDERVLATIRGWQRKMEESRADEDANEVLAVIEGDLPLVTTTSVVRRSESTFGNMLADCMMARFPHADCAIINGGFMRDNAVYEPGAVLCVGTVRNECPFPKKLVQIKIKACDLRQALAQQVRSLPAPSGSFPHLCHTLRAVVNTRDNSIDSFTLNDAELEGDREVRLVCTEFMAIGGDECVAFTRGKEEERADEIVADTLINWLRRKGRLEAAAGRLRLV